MNTILQREAQNLLTRGRWLLQSRFYLLHLFSACDFFNLYFTQFSKLNTNKPFQTQIRKN